MAGLWDVVWEARLRRSPPTVYRAALIALGVAMGRKTLTKNVCERTRARVYAQGIWGTQLIFYCLIYSKKKKVGINKWQS